MLVQTIEKKLLKSARIPRNQLSRRLSEFCGDYPAYEMKRITVDDVAQFSINREGKLMLTHSDSKCFIPKCVRASIIFKHFVGIFILTGCLYRPRDKNPSLRAQSMIKPRLTTFKNSYFLAHACTYFESDIFSKLYCLKYSFSHASETPTIT